MKNSPSLFLTSHRAAKVGGWCRGFTLVEMLISMLVLSVLFATLGIGIRQTQRAWNTAHKSAEEFREARRAFDTMTRRLGQATLNNYWGYDNPAQPTFYQRQSELHFVAGPVDAILPAPSSVQSPGTGPRLHSGHGLFFQAPLGYSGDDSTAGNSNFNQMDDLLNCWGFYVEYGSDIDGSAPFRPPFLNSDLVRNPERKRFRLIEYRLPSERFPLYENTGVTTAVGMQAADIARTTNAEDTASWYRDPALRLPFSRPIAENIVAVIFSPRAPGTEENAVTTGVDDYDIAPTYRYDSRLHQWLPNSALAAATRHAMPPVVQVTCFAVDDASWDLFHEIHGPTGATALASFVAGRFQNVSDYDKDVLELEEYLTSQNLHYYTFVNNVPIRGAKWVTEKL